MSTIKFNFFRFSWKFILKRQFLFCYYPIMLLSSCLLFYICCFLISLFAGWRYAGRIFNAGICRGKAISEFRKPEGPPPAPPPSWARKEFCVVVCATLLTFVCMLRYSEWNVVPSWFLYSSIFMVVRCADLVPGFFDIYGGMLCQSAIWFWDSSLLIVVRCANLLPGFFATYGGTLCRSGSWILQYL